MGVSLLELGGERGGRRPAGGVGRLPLRDRPHTHPLCGGLARGSASSPSSLVALGEGGLRPVWGLPGALREGLVSSNPPT